MTRFTTIVALLASFSAVLTSPITERTDTESFRIQIDQAAVVYADPAPYYLTPEGGFTHDIDLAGIYTLNPTSSQLLVNGKPIGAVRGENFTVFRPSDAVNQITTIFYLDISKPDFPKVKWVNAEWRNTAGNDGEAVFAGGLVGSESLVYAFFADNVPESYNLADLLAKDL